MNRFSVKILIWGKEPFWAQKLHILITLDLLEEFFLIMHNEKGQQVDESNNNNGLYQKNFCAGQMGHFGPEDGAYPHNSESNLRFFKNILQNERG